jgi:galactose-1-phosphate uridylyltransferase
MSAFPPAAGPASGAQAAPASRPSILDLETAVAALPAADRARFERIFHLAVATANCAVPEPMQAWVTTQFGSVDAVREQRIVKVTNRITFEGSLFNTLRALRPLQSPAGGEDLEAAIRASQGGPFCHPEEQTPADLFGRIRGPFALTASNVAKYDGWHGVIIFDEHHPLRFSAEQVASYLETAQAWCRRAHAADPEAVYPFFLWNCLWRSGSSILHGHAQVTLTRGMHYAPVEQWRQAALGYRSRQGQGYFDDLIAVYRSLGLAVAWGSATIFPSLTPYKEKEVCIVSPALDGDLKGALYGVLAAYTRRLGVRSFNLALYQPPLAETPEDWQGFPVCVRLLDRGDLDSRTSDIGAMEIFGQAVVSTDPYRVADLLRESLRREAAWPGEAAGLQVEGRSR